MRNDSRQPASLVRVAGTRSWMKRGAGSACPMTLSGFLPCRLRCLFRRSVVNNLLRIVAESLLKF
jgi:hypothetical protein